MTNGTRAECSAQQKDSTHRGLRNKPEYTWISASTGHPLVSNGHMDKKHGSHGVDPHRSYLSPSCLRGWLSSSGVYQPERVAGHGSRASPPPQTCQMAVKLEVMRVVPLPPHGQTAINPPRESPPSCKLATRKSLALLDPYSKQAGGCYPLHSILLEEP